MHVSLVEDGEEIDREDLNHVNSNQGIQRENAYFQINLEFKQDESNQRKNYQLNKMKTLKPKLYKIINVNEQKIVSNDSCFDEQIFNQIQIKLVYVDSEI